MAIGTAIADTEHALHGEQQQGDGQHGGRHHLDDGGRVDGPHEEGHAIPGHAGGTHLVDRHDEVHAGEDGGKAEHEGGHDHHHDRAIHPRAVGRVEGPASVDATRDGRPKGHDGARDIDVVARQVELGECHVLGAELQRQDKVAQSSGNARDDDQEDHHQPVESKEAVVGVAFEDLAALNRDAGGVEVGGEELPAHQRGKSTAQQERSKDGEKVHHADPLVIDGQ